MIKKPTLRDYQSNVIDQARESYRGGNRNVCVVLPTGAGKTVTLAYMVDSASTACCVIAHRQELVVQLSLALARNAVVHNVIGSASTCRTVAKVHLEELGKSYFNPGSNISVASVDTLTKRSGLDGWAKTVGLWVVDECHHLLEENKWGKAVALFPNAKGMGVTATPCRADGKGLGRHASGLFDDMVVGLNMRQLINNGSLTEYRIFAPPGDVDLSNVGVSATTGDYSKGQLNDAMKKSHIIGDIITHYQRIAAGKLGITFVTDVATAEEVAAQYNSAGIPAAVISAKTPDLTRIQVMRKFRERKLLQLVNVDILGEGVDVPAVEVVSMARPTQSFGLYAQQFGRALRPSPGKEHAIIIDHVGNVQRHGLVDSVREWTLDDRKRRKRSASDNITVKTCSECTAVYERYLKACPFCNHVEVIKERKRPEQVDGDLTELTPDVLAQMRQQVKQVDQSVDTYHQSLVDKHCPEIGIRAHMKRFKATQRTQTVLRATMAKWAGYRRAEGHTDDEIYRLFYLNHGIDWLSAMTLQSKKAEGLNHAIESMGS